MNKQSNDEKNSFLKITLIAMVFLVFFSGSAVALDTIDPKIHSVSIANREEDVSTDELITVVFSEDMDRSSINTNTFTVMQRTTPESGQYRMQAVDGTIIYNNRRATFTPDEILSPNQEFGNVFTVTISDDVKDLAGNPLTRDYVWSFTTGVSSYNTGGSTSQLNQNGTVAQEAVSAPADSADQIRPKILSLSVINNEEDVSTDEQVEVVFSEDMDPSTINAGTIIMMQRTTPEFGEYRLIPVKGAVTYDGRKATFTSDDLYSPDQEFGNVFTVTVTTGAKDLAGNSIARDYVWSFTTGTNPFYTGDSTSQQDQNSALTGGSTPVKSSAQTPIVTSQVTTTQATTPTAAGGLAWWVWAIGGLILLLLIALFFLPNKKDESQKVISTSRPNPFGDVHPVMDLEGIGPEYKDRLQTMGIKNTQQLWEANAIKVARETGAPISTVKGWQSMAELASVKGIGPQYAELLERSGIHSIDQLKNYDPKELLKLVRKKQDSLEVNIQGNFPGPVTVENWIGEARDHKFTVSTGETA